MPKKSKKEKEIKEEETSDDKIVTIGDESEMLSSDLNIEEDSDEEELEDFEGE